MDGVEERAAEYEDFHAELPEELVAPLEAAESPDELAETYEELADENPNARWIHVPGEVAVRDERIEPEWVLRGTTAAAYIGQRLQLAEDSGRAECGEGDMWRSCACRPAVVGAVAESGCRVAVRDERRQRRLRCCTPSMEQPGAG